MWDAHEAIIPMEDFARVQKEIERRTKKNGNMKAQPVR
jgi:hypothetical protein